MDSPGFIKASRGPEALEVIRANPLAYVLAAVIARRAYWLDGFNARGLESGEAFLGDFRSYGMTEQQYRTAKEQLSKWGFATFTPTNKGTVARLTDTRLFDPLNVTGNEQDNGRPTDGQRTSNGRPTDGQRTANGRPTDEQRTGNGRPTDEQRTANGRATDG